MEDTSHPSDGSNDELSQVRLPGTQHTDSAAFAVTYNDHTDAPQMSPGELLTELQSLLECPVCREVFLPPSLQCWNGHVICSDCRRGSPTCPLCRARKERIRNVGLEKLLKAARFPCKYAPSWCAASIPLSAKHKHEEQCGFGGDGLVFDLSTAQQLLNGADLIIEDFINSAGLRIRLPRLQDSESAAFADTYNHRTDAPQVSPGELLTELQSLLECPVCREVFLPPTLQCWNGHVICSDCRKGSPTCPLCRARKVGTCLVVEAREHQEEDDEKREQTSIRPQ
ncbi:hypothetical protein HPB52_020165 [Rhipicephalus sanguineus]|uniref:RING-type domain-containing protein n=1 Tax=Rhipicephalus sanguineus TaxID=34632 RepID=A0A9D4SQQ8_RHISA|nr:hypothetical protein HPB52_020165 [Rhipicephalus sanguineus]